MKEYIIKEKNGKYEYGYRIQKLDIELMIELGLDIPYKLKQIYGEGFKENELEEYVYINDSIVVEFIKRQYYIRDYIEFANLNLYEIELLQKINVKKFKVLTNMIRESKTKEQLLDLKTKLNILVNEIIGIDYLKKEKEIKNKRK